jgi:23S rRNA (guanine2445-N2)-methyltransferase / 23S rRNA (guanine2069-N7)-methyltransferase
LKETLAAALVDLSFWKPDRPLWDPFCGSGTIAIEAARLARNIAPGIERTFAAEAWPAIAPDCWDQARQAARDAEVDPPAGMIHATDLDGAELEIARAHAAAAGVADDIHFQQMDFREVSSQRPYGCLICNPPYGERVGDPAAVDAIYAEMPAVFRRMKTWSFYVLTAWGGFERILGQQADRRRKLYNGPIECTYYQFHGPRPPKSGQAPPPEKLRVVQPDAEPDQTPAFGGLVEHNLDQAEAFANRLTKNARHLRRWPKKGITCYRLYDRDIPEVPLVVDRYEDHLHMAEYQRPHDRTAAEHADWLDLMVRTAAEAVEIDPGNVAIKTRRRQKGLDQYEKLDQAGRTIVVGEAGLRFEVNLTDYLDTGLFLDHRNTRQMVRDRSAGTRFVNLFCYTGAFTVYAAAGAAETTLSVDLSRTYLDWARRNLELNGLAGPAHRLQAGDVMEFVADHRPDAPYDLAVVDPPTFSNSKSLRRDFDIQRDYPELLRGVLEMMAPGGLIYFSSNFRRLKFDESELPGARIHEISKQTVPEDFRNRRIHRCWAIYRRK